MLIANRKLFELDEQPIGESSSGVVGQSKQVSRTRRRDRALLRQDQAQPEVDQSGRGSQREQDQNVRAVARGHQVLVRDRLEHIGGVRDHARLCRVLSHHQEEGGRSEQL